MTYQESKHNPAITALWPYLLLTVVVTLGYASTLAGGFVWDDSLFTANSAYWKFDLRTIFFSLTNGLEYQPIRDITFLADIALWGNRPFGFHLTNLLLFLLIVVLVYRLFLRLCAWLRREGAANVADRYVALGGALLFAMHPLRSEVVAWVTQRNTLLATLFSLLSLLLFCGYLEAPGNRKLLVASLATFVLALFSKATVVVLPLLLLLLSRCRGGEGRIAWRPTIPFFAVSAMAALLHIAIARQTSVISGAYIGSMGERVAVALQIPLHYLGKTVLPTGLSAYYPDRFSRLLLSLPVVANCTVLLLTTVVVWRLRRLPELFFGYGWFLVSLLPVSNLFATSPVVADRYTFLPAVGLSFTAAAIAARSARGEVSRRLVVLAAIVLLLVLTIVTAGRNRVWRSDIALWSDTAARAPGVASVWYNLGRAWHRTPRLGMALDAYLRALRLDPNDMKSLDNAAALFPSSAGPLSIRRELVAGLVAQMPQSPAGLALIGHTPLPWNNPENAETLFLRLLEADPSSLELQLALANLYLKVGAVDRAIAIYGETMASGAGRGEAEFGLARIAAIRGDRPAVAQLVSTARQKGGVPDSLLQLVEK